MFSVIQQECSACSLSGNQADRAFNSACASLSNTEAGGKVVSQLFTLKVSL